MAFILRKLVILGISAVLGLSLSCVSIARPMPGGNYDESCHKCSWSKKYGFLRCKCKDRDGNNKKTSLYVHGCKTVENDNGNLYCTKHFRHPDHHHSYHPDHHHHKKEDVDAGAIWSQPDAEQVCPAF